MSEYDLVKPSPDNRHNAELVWLGEYSQVIVDVEQRRTCLVAHPDGLGILPVSFDGSQLICRSWTAEMTWAINVAMLEGWNEALDAQE